MSNPSQKLSSRLALRAAATALVIVLALTVATTPAAQAQTFTVVHAFTGGADGGNPFAGLTADRAGNFYGTTAYGGHTGGNCGGGVCGTVFKVARAGNGWVLTPLYAFLGGSDGMTPEARVVFGPDGSLYGTTSIYTVFNLKPPATRPASVFSPWTEKTLYEFSGGSDGVFPEGDLTFDQAGNVYGGVFAGGGGPCYEGCGNIYKLSPSNGGWTETTVYGFQGIPDGSGPTAGVIFDGEGNLYGTTFEGGTYGYGTVFRLRPSGSGWIEDILHSFQSSDGGYYPGAGLIWDGAGNLYGSTTDGPGSSGVIFELSPSNGGWTYTVLAQIPSSYEGGPKAPLVMDQAGNLYGTIDGYCEYCWGAVFKLTHGSGGWTFTSLHDFTGGSDGGHPYSNLVFDANGNLYGTASNGGPVNDKCQYQSCGIVFEITP